MRSAQGHSLPETPVLLPLHHPRRAKTTTELINKHKGAAERSHQFLKTEESREDVRIGVSQKFGFFHHLKYILFLILVQHPHSAELLFKTTMQ